MTCRSLCDGLSPNLPDFFSCSTPDTLSSLFLKPTGMLPHQSHFTLAFPMSRMQGGGSGPPWVQAVRGCIVWREFKTIIKVIKSLSAFYYHHVPTTLNRVGDKILLEEADHSHNPALDLPLCSNTHVACALAAFMSLLKIIYSEKPSLATLSNILSSSQLFISPFSFFLYGT